MSDRRVLGFVWLALAGVLFLVLQDLSAWAFGIARIANPEFLGRAIDGSDLLAMLLTVVIALASWKHEQVHQFSIETVQETRKVVWPTRKETRDHTVTVIIVSVILSLMLWGFDLVWKRLFSLILNMGA